MDLAAHPDLPSQIHDLILPYVYSYVAARGGRVQSSPSSPDPRGPQRHWPPGGLAGHPSTNSANRRRAGLLVGRRSRDAPTSSHGVAQPRGQACDQERRRSPLFPTSGPRKRPVCAVNGQEGTLQAPRDDPQGGRVRDFPYNRTRGRLTAWRRIGAPSRVLWWIHSGVPLP